MSTAKRRSTYADVLAAPENVVAEVVDGELYTHARPRAAHAIAHMALAHDIYDAFHRGRSGPGGWVVLAEPELHLGGEPDIVAPDIAAWRREHLDDAALAGAFITSPPDCRWAGTPARAFSAHLPA